MRIRVWNAYASNNSGSYAIVGRFASDQAAEDWLRLQGGDHSSHPDSLPSGMEVQLVVRVAAPLDGHGEGGAGPEDRHPRLPGSIASVAHR